MKKYNKLLFFLAFFQPFLICAQVELKHIIDYSENGEALYFETISQDEFEIIISPNSGKERLCVFVSNGAQSKELTFKVRTNSQDFCPAISYDEKEWEPVSFISNDGEYFSFHFKSLKNSVFISLNDQSRNPVVLKSATDIPYYDYQRYIAFVDSVATNPNVELENIGKSVEKRDIKLLTITNPSIPDSTKKNVWILFRQHCDEDRPSYIFEGMARFLLSDTSVYANEILSRIIFKIVPIVNVDGVFHQQRRVNVNGVDLNRCWVDTQDHSAEQPEVRAVHNAIDDWILNKGNKISFLLDMHNWGEEFDGGYKSRSTQTSSAYVAELNTFLNNLNEEDHLLVPTSWSFSTGSLRMARLALYNQHKITIITSESAQEHRFDGTPVTPENLTRQGPDFVRGLYNYLFHANFISKTTGEKVERYSESDSIYINVADADENSIINYSDKIKITLSTSSGDFEEITLNEIANREGTFQNVLGIPVEVGIPSLNDGKIQGQYGDLIKAYYQDHNYPDDNCTVIATLSNATYARSDAVKNNPVLNQNYPNPFRNGTTVSYQLAENAHVSINIFNMAGQKVKTLINKNQQAGFYSLVWDAVDDNGNTLPPGIFYCTMRIGDTVLLNRKMIRLK